jgi:class 3 adenylate cyclase
MVRMEKKDYRLAAILYTDIAGFSKMMEKNEARTLELLHIHNELIKGVVSAHGGTVIKTIGDAFLIDFKNTVNALQSAIEIQYKLYEYNKLNPELPLLVRIGVHLGDIYFYENDALGEGINIAARLQSIAHPGCICMSGDVYNIVLNKVDFTAEKLGRVSLKNISKEIHAFEIATPNVEFDKNRDARPILRPDKTDKITGETLPGADGDDQTATSSSGGSAGAAAAAARPASRPPARDLPAQAATADEAAVAADVKRRILADIKAAGARLGADQMLARYGAEGQGARIAVDDLVRKGILVAGSTAPASAAAYRPAAEPARDRGVVGMVNDLEYRIEDEIKRGLDEAFSRRKRGDASERRHEIRENARELRREIRAEIHARRDDRELSAEERKAAAEEGKWDGKVAKSYFKSAADTATDFDRYAEKVKAEARSSKVAFVGHLASFIAVNALLMGLNAATSAGFPWALFPFGGWGIGLLEHLASTLRRGDRARELERLPPLDAARLNVFKKLQRAKDSIWLHLTSTIGTTVFLAMINGVTSSGFQWWLFPAVGMGVGLITHAASYFGRKREMERSLIESFGLTGSWNSALRRMPAAMPTDGADLGPYRELVDEAKATRAAIVAQLGAGVQPKAKAKAKRGREAGQSDLVDGDFLPTLDSYVEQVSVMAKRTYEVDRIIEYIPMEALAADKEGLRRKIDAQPGESLLREYRKSMSEIDRQETSFNELKEQREVLELRMRSSVNTLKQMRIDLARLQGMSDRDDNASARAVKDKTAELNRYLDDLRSGYDELDRLEASHALPQLPDRPSDSAAARQPTAERPLPPEAERSEEEAGV